MAQRSYHPLAKVAFTAAAILTLLTLTLHGHHAPANAHTPNSPVKTGLHPETPEFPR